MSETREPQARRARRKYVAGFFEQTATVIGGAASGLFTAGVAAPLVAAALGEIAISSAVVATIAVTALGATALLWAVSARLRGSAKRLDDDGSNWPPVATKADGGYMESSDTERRP